MSNVSHHNMLLFITTICAVLALIYGLLAPFLTPPLINSAFEGGYFWSAVANMFAAGLTVAYLYGTRGGKSRLTCFVFGIALVAMATVLYGNLGMILDHAKKAEKYMPNDQVGLFVGFQLFALYAKDLVALSFGAIGANLAASSILERLPPRDG